jgi:hypothetical protein
MALKKLTPLFVVDDIDAVLPTWAALGYEPIVRVPDEGPLGFAILKGAPGELMFQTKASLKEDLPMVHERKPKAFLYADVDSIAATKKALRDAEVLIAHRKTFYGAKEAWLALEGGVVLGLAEHGD